MKINNTKIQYLKIEDKIYRVTSLHLFYLSLEAEETNLSIDDVPQEELFDISGFKDFKIHLVNNKGKADIVDMAEWKCGRA